MEKTIAKLLGIVLCSALLFGCAYIEKPITSRIKTTEPVERPYVLQPKSIQVNDITVKYMEAGQGPTVVMVHGGVIPMGILRSYIPPLTQMVLHSSAVATADSWNYNIKALAENYHVVALDLPGFGGSDKPDISYTIDQFVIYLDGFMNAKGIQNASLVGHGLGGQIVMTYALDYPEKVNSLVLVNTFGGYGGLSMTAVSPLNWKIPLLNVRWPMGYWQKEKAAQINIKLPLNRKMYRGWKKPVEFAVQSTLQEKVVGDKPDNLIYSDNERSKDFMKAVTDYKLAYITTEESRKEVHAVHRALLETKRGYLHSRFQDIDKPVLLIQGAHDPVVEIEQVQFISSSLPASQMIVYEASGHYPMVEEAERFNRDVSYFLSGEVMALGEQ